MACQTCSSECSKKNLLFSDVEAWRLFSPQILQCSKRRPFWDIFYVLYKWLSLGYFLFMFLLSQIRPASLYEDTVGDGNKYLIYLTHWTFVVFLVSLSMRALFATYYALFPPTLQSPVERKQKDETKNKDKDASDENIGSQDIENNQNTNNDEMDPQPDEMDRQSDKMDMQPDETNSPVNENDAENGEADEKLKAKSKGSIKEKPERFLLVSPVPWYLYINWALYELTATANSVVTVLFWGLLYHKDYKLQPTTTTTHGLNMLYSVVIDMLITAMPVRLLHFWMPICYALVYVIFSVIYEENGGTNTNGEPHIYGVIDWTESPGLAAGYCAGSLVATAILHCVLFGAYQLRMYLYALICRRHHSHQQRHSSQSVKAKSPDTVRNENVLVIDDSQLNKPVSLPNVAKEEETHVKTVFSNDPLLAKRADEQPDSSDQPVDKLTTQSDPKVVKSAETRISYRKVASQVLKEDPTNSPSNRIVVDEPKNIINEEATPTKLKAGQTEEQQPEKTTEKAVKQSVKKKKKKPGKKKRKKK